jgi:hypothetical protein
VDSKQKEGTKKTWFDAPFFSPLNMSIQIHFGKLTKMVFLSVCELVKFTKNTYFRGKFSLCDKKIRVFLESIFRRVNVKNSITFCHHIVFVHFDRGLSIWDIAVVIWISFITWKFILINIMLDFHLFLYRIKFRGFDGGIGTFFHLVSGFFGWFYYTWFPLFLFFCFSGAQMYTNDERFVILHNPNSNQWTLQVKFVQKRDHGTYECQVRFYSFYFISFFNQFNLSLLE